MFNGGVFSLDLVLISSYMVDQTNGTFTGKVDPPNQWMTEKGEILFFVTPS